MFNISLWDFLAEDQTQRELAQSEGLLQSQIEDDLEIMNYLALSEILDDEFLVDSLDYYSEDSSDGSND